MLNNMRAKSKNILESLRLKTIDPKVIAVLSSSVIALGITVVAVFILSKPHDNGKIIKDKMTTLTVTDPVNVATNETAPNDIIKSVKKITASTVMPPRIAEVNNPPPRISSSKNLAEKQSVEKITASTVMPPRIAEVNNLPPKISSSKNLAEKQSLEKITASTVMPPRIAEVNNPPPKINSNNDKGKGKSESDIKQDDGVSNNITKIETAIKRLRSRLEKPTTGSEWFRIGEKDRPIKNLDTALVSLKKEHPDLEELKESRKDLYQYISSLSLKREKILPIGKGYPLSSYLNWAYFKTKLGDVRNIQNIIEVMGKVTENSKNRYPVPKANYFTLVRYVMYLNIEAQQKCWVNKGQDEILLKNIKDISTCSNNLVKEVEELASQFPEVFEKKLLRNAIRELLWSLENAQSTLLNVGYNESLHSELISACKAVTKEMDSWAKKKGLDKDEAAGIIAKIKNSITKIQDLVQKNSEYTVDRAGPRGFGAKIGELGKFLFQQTKQLIEHKDNESPDSKLNQVNVTPSEERSRAA